MSTEILRLANGRILAFDVHGPADGHPLFYFHGAPSARTEVEFFRLPEVCERLGIRLISPDRPGLGRSDYQPSRTISDWPADVQALADRLGLDRFSVLGYSGGGPYALACAQLIPDRLASVTLVSSTGPHEIEGMTDSINPNSLKFMRMSVHRPWMGRLVTRAMAFMARRFPGKMAAQAISSLPEPDARFMSDPANGREFARLVTEAARSGGRGPQHDTALMVIPWGLDLPSIETPVTMWHGEEDRNAPVIMGRWIAEQLPAATLNVLPGEGHLSFFSGNAERILRDALQRG